MIEPHEIPGEIEPAEQRLLTELAESLEFNTGDSIVEFGTLFGRSTACIARGLAARPNGGNSAPVVYAYDSFKCREPGPMAAYIRNLGEKHGFGELIECDDDVLSFRKVFDHYLSDHQKAGRVSVFEAEIEHAQWTGATIALMHVDAPKMYRELKFIIDEFFPKLRVGSTIVFQDFFLHWSTSLIAAVQLMCETGILKVERSAASSLVTSVLDVPNATSINHIDDSMKSSFLPDIIDRAIESLDANVIDRPQQFIPRLILAKISPYWSEGRYKDAKRCFGSALVYSGQYGKLIISDFGSMMGRGFEYEEFYQHNRFD